MGPSFLNLIKSYEKEEPTISKRQTVVSDVSHKMAKMIERIDSEKEDEFSKEASAWLSIGEEIENVEAVDEKALSEPGEEPQADVLARLQEKADEKALREAEERARIDFQERERKEVEERTPKESGEKLRREVEEKARREAVEKIRKEAEEKARREAEEKARREAEEKARREAVERTRKEAEEKAQGLQRLEELMNKMNEIEKNTNRKVPKKTGGQ